MLINNDPLSFCVVFGSVKITPTMEGCFPGLCYVVPWMFVVVAIWLLSRLL